MRDATIGEVVGQLGGERAVAKLLVLLQVESSAATKEKATRTTSNFWTKESSRRILEAVSVLPHTTTSNFSIYLNSQVASACCTVARSAGVSKVVQLI